MRGAYRVNPGKIFEEDIRDSVPKDVYYLRLRDPILSDGNDGYRFGSKCPYDILLYLKPHQYCLELKSTAGTSISYDGNNPMIKRHQIECLTEAAQYEGVVCGFLLNYRRTGGTYFVPISSFLVLKEESARKSINENDAKRYGIPIPSRLKKTRHAYDLDALFGRGQMGLLTEEE